MLPSPAPLQSTVPDPQTAMPLICHACMCSHQRGRIDGFARAACLALLWSCCKADVYACVCALQLLAMEGDGHPHMLHGHCLPPHPCLTSINMSPAATSKDEAMAVLDEEDLDAVGGGWGEEDDMAGAGVDEDADAEAGPRGEGDGLGGSEGDEEGGWEMEVGHGGV